MPIPQYSLLTIVIFILGASHPNADDPKTAPAIKVEFRRAETKAHEGLSEATVVGSADKIYLHKNTELTNRDIAEAIVQLDSVYGQTAISVTFNEAGSKKMFKLTGEHQGKLLAILIDGKVVCAPTIQSPLKTGAIISGKFSKQEAEKWAQAMNPKK